MNNYNEPTPAEELGILYQIRQAYGIAGDTDGYKITHAPQYKKGADMMSSYFESRGGRRDRILNFGVQMLIKEYFLQRITAAQAYNMVEWATEYMGGNMAKNLEIALRKVVNELDGRLPIRIRNAPEGLMIPKKNIILVIETSIPGEEWFSLVSYFETKLVRVWGPMTVGTTSWYVREAILAELEKTSDDPAAYINFMFHDFGGRGVPDMGTAAFNGSAHLVSFMGTDTTVAVQALEFAYQIRMAGYSIPASEHSSTTSHGRLHEIDLITQMFDAYAKPGKAFATVIDSWDALNFVREYAPLFKDRLIESGAKWVFRPDSGDPIKMPIKIIEELDKIFGHTVNKKGYKILNNVGVIQGDGIVPEQVGEILNALIAKGWCASNMAFGMGGGLLQKVNRDTYKFALKCSAIRINGEWEDVWKDPAVYDDDWNVLDVEGFKTSKAGRLELIYNAGLDEYKTVRLEDVDTYGNEWSDTLLETVYENGYLVRDMTFAEVRANAGTM